MSATAVETDARVLRRRLRSEMSFRIAREDFRELKIELPRDLPEDLGRLTDDELVRAFRDLDATDDRKELTDPSVSATARQRARSVCGVIPRSLLRQREDGRLALGALTLHQRGAARTERFREQPVAADGTAFLVAPDVVATALHIANRNAPERLAFVFDYIVQNGRGRTVFPQADVRVGKKIIWQDRLADLALMRLDAPVEGRPSLPLRRTSSAGNGEAVYMIGTPLGLPLKLTGNARVTANSDPRFFTADLDTMDANSGSPVFSSATNEVLGVLSEGPTGFQTFNGVLVSFFGHGPNTVPTKVSRITQLLQL